MYLVDSVYMGLVFVSTQPVCLLAGAVNPFTFKVIINMYGPIVIVHCSVVSSSL